MINKQWINQSINQSNERSKNHTRTVPVHQHQECQSGVDHPEKIWYTGTRLQTLEKPVKSHKFQHPIDSDKGIRWTEAGEGQCEIRRNNTQNVQLASPCGQIRADEFARLLHDHTFLLSTIKGCSTHPNFLLKKFKFSIHYWVIEPSAHSTQSFKFPHLDNLIKN